MTEHTSQALEEQIAELQRQLDATRAESGQDDGTPYERSEVHAAVEDQIQQQVPSYQAPVSPSSDDAVFGDTPSYQDPALADQVQVLVDVAFTKGVSEAIAQAVKTGNAALIDALHDVLADELHEELLKRQKIEPAM